MTAEREGAEVEAVLAAHAPLSGQDCACGWRVNRSVQQRRGEWVYVAGPWAQQYAAHVADALAPLIAGRERLAAERALREAADAILRVDLPFGRQARSAWLNEQADAYAQGGERP